MANIRKFSRTVSVAIHEDTINQYQSGCRFDKIQIENYLVERLTDSMKNAKKEIEIELLASLRGLGDVYHELEDVAPVVHAHWIRHDDDGVYHECSNCGVHDYWNTSNVYIIFDYCPECGAKMDEEV